MEIVEIERTIGKIVGIAVEELEHAEGPHAKEVVTNAKMLGKTIIEGGKRGKMEEEVILGGILQM